MKKPIPGGEKPLQPQTSPEQIQEEPEEEPFHISTYIPREVLEGKVKRTPEEDAELEKQLQKLIKQWKAEGMKIRDGSDTDTTQ